MKKLSEDEILERARKTYGARVFSKESYEENDKYAKDIFIKYIISKGHEVLKHDESYDHDVITSKDGKIFHYEVEVKRGYPFTNRAKYQFDTVHFLGRKNRLHIKTPYTYVIICRETDWAVCCESKDIFKDEYEKKVFIDTGYRYGDDLMYDVPKEKCKFFKIKK